MIAKHGSDLPASPGCLPNTSQRELLKVACAPAEIARQAWQTWRAHYALDGQDPAISRLLVWIYSRRNELHLTPEEIAALEPSYRFAWLQNQRLLNSAALLAEALEKEGIEILFLKGIPLLIDAYQDEGARYMADFDLMVRPIDLERLLPVMSKLGWNPSTPGIIPNALHLRHSAEFKQADGLSCDVHWSLLRPPFKPVSEEYLWAGKRPFPLRDQAAFSAPVELNLINLFVHGMCWEQIPPIRWILDVHLLLKRHEPDWNLLLAEARSRQVMLPVAEAVATYTEIVPGEIPGQVCKQALAFRPTAKQVRAYQKVVLPYEDLSLRGAYEVFIADFKLAKSLGKLRPGIFGIIDHLCRYLRVPNLGRLPGELAVRLARRFSAKPPTL